MKNKLDDTIKKIFPSIMSHKFFNNDVYYFTMKNLTEVDNYIVIYHNELDLYRYKGKLYSETDFIRILQLLVFE